MLTASEMIRVFLILAICLFAIAAVWVDMFFRGG